MNDRLRGFPFACTTTYVASIAAAAAVSAAAAATAVFVRFSLFVLRASFFLYTSLPFRFRFHFTFIVLDQEQERYEKGTEQQPYYQTTHEQRAIRSAHYTVKHSIFIAYV